MALSPCTYYYDSCFQRRVFTVVKGMGMPPISMGFCGDSIPWGVVTGSSQFPHVHGAFGEDRLCWTKDTRKGLTAGPHMLVPCVCLMINSQVFKENKRIAVKINLKDPRPEVYKVNFGRNGKSK